MKKPLTRQQAGRPLTDAERARLRKYNHKKLKRLNVIGKVCRNIAIVAFICIGILGITGVSTYTTGITTDSQAPTPEDNFKVTLVTPEPSVEPTPIEEVVPDAPRYDLSEEELLYMAKCVEAEVTGEHGFYIHRYGGGVCSDQELLESKLRVAQVILNRVESPYFPDNVMDVIFQKNAFSPTVDGRIWDVTPGDLTYRAIDLALDVTTPDYTEGALFFQMYYCEPNPYGEYLFTDPIGHEYYSYRR